VAALDEVAASPQTPDLTPIAKQAVAAAFWMWFYNNQDKQVVKTKVWFLNVNITVGMLQPLFVMLFGPDPSGR
jgi:hypothetical protein